MFPGAIERCNEADDDAGDAPTWHPDDDGDGFGDAEVTYRACTRPGGDLADGSDCAEQILLETEGAIHVVAGDVDGDGGGLPDVVLSRYSTGASFHSQGTVFAHGWTGSGASAEASPLYWGSVVGFSAGNVTELPTAYVGGLPIVVGG